MNASAVTFIVDEKKQNESGENTDARNNSALSLMHMLNSNPNIGIYKGNSPTPRDLQIIHRGNFKLTKE
jgi:hypothetical protein